MRGAKRGDPGVGTGQLTSRCGVRALPGKAPTAGPRPGGTREPAASGRRGGRAVGADGGKSGRPPSGAAEPAPGLGPPPRPRPRAPGRWGRRPGHHRPGSISNRRFCGHRPNEVLTDTVSCWGVKRVNALQLQRITVGEPLQKGRAPGVPAPRRNPHEGWAGWGVGWK